MVAGDHNLRVIQFFVEKAYHLIFHGLDPYTAVEIGEQDRLLENCGCRFGGLQRAEGLSIHIEQQDIGPAIDGMQNSSQLLIAR